MRKQVKTAVKWSVAAVAFVLIAVILTGYSLGWFGEKKEIQAEENTVQSGGMVMPEASDGMGISLTSAVIPVSQYEDYGIMPIAENAYAVKATVTDDGGLKPDYLQKVKWTMAWKSTNSSDVSTFVKMTTNESTATFSCLKAFSTQIVVTCTSTLDETKTATVTLDYAKRLTGVKVQFLDDGEQTVAKSGTTVTVTFPANYTIGGSSPVTSGNFIADKLIWFKSLVFGGEGTVENSGYCDLTITPTSAFKSAYNTYKSTSVSGLTESVTATSHSSSTLDAIKSINNFYGAITGCTGNLGALAGMGIYHALSTAFYNTSGAQFTVSLKITPNYGEAETYTYSLRVLMDKPPVKSVSVDHSSHTF